MTRDERATSADRPRSRRRVIVVVVVGVALAWVGFVGVSLLLAARDAATGRDEVDAVRATLPGGVDPLVQAVSTPGDDIAEESAAERLRGAAGHFASASDRTGSLLLAPIRILPIVGRQVRSAHAISTSAAEVARLGADAIDRSNELLTEPSSSGPDRVVVMQHLTELLHGYQDQLADLDLGPREALVGPLARARDKFDEQLAEAREALDRAVPAAEGTTRFLQGPSRYLLLAANNSEMRAGSGMFLQAGILTVDDGVFTVDEMTPTGELKLPPGAVPLDGDVADRWGWLVPTEEWRNLNLTPRFDVSASLAAQMWEARGGGAVDGVVAVDAVALRGLVAGVGPIDVDGRTLDADQVLQDLLLDQYVDFASDRDQRRDHLGRVVHELTAAIDRGGWSTADVVREMANVAPGRHVLAWSADAEEQRGWEAMGIDGTMPPDALTLAVSNRGANKLDQFLAVSATVDVQADDDSAGSGSTVEVDVTVTNNSPEQLPTYVAGPNVGSPVGEGVYLGFVSLTIPGAAGNGRIEGGQPTALGPDGPVRVMATLVEVPRGASTTVRFHFELPEGSREMNVLPSARVPPIRWQFDATTRNGASRPDSHSTWLDERPQSVFW
jgi:hypothetical protein